ncbi:MAG TPA: tRNA preQ1(34) S-adenosylmethionine ribosyltransferase-isomerase QueA [Patescibacteria group bacterium]|nr:tRNA preQ1(34) S-adenosylmethionine ribosyltransferase-isomerase QueA [Patescibacteria group bacterium]
MDLEKLLNKYNYEFPKSLIATEPAHPRESARLMIYNRKTKQIHSDTFANLTKYLPKKTVLVFNETKVIPARLPVTKETGGKVNLLYIKHEKKSIVAKSDKPLSPGQVLYIDKHHTLIAKNKSPDGWILFSNLTAVKFKKLLKKYGITPLPPYIKNSKLNEAQIKKEYQTVFAKIEGSVAAPTASLHFSKQLLLKLKRSGVKTCFVTLHVGLGTFAPLTEQHIKTKTLHEERYAVSEATFRKLQKLKANGYTIIPVGTTALRTLETIFTHSHLRGTTNLFIQEGYTFKCIDGLITNFHVPRSSLLMLVSALLGRKKTLELYKYAMKQKFRFFSFGDGMLII